MSIPAPRASVHLARLPILVLLLAAAAALANDRLPALPLPPQPAAGVTNTFVLRNEQLEVVIFPAAGRIGGLGPLSGPSLLRLDTNLLPAADQPAEGWKNFGGDWLWPVMQARWSGIGGSDWPPPAVLETRPWQATAWVDVRGDRCCLLTNFFGPPVNLAAQRLIRLDAEQARVSIEQRLTRTAPSDLPACLWQISQVAGAEEAALATSTDSAFSNGVRVLGFTPPPAEITADCVSARVYRVADGTEHKLGSDAPAAWVAARRGDRLLVARARGDTGGGAWPDGGCRVEFYSNRGLGYTEIETVSAERTLKPGESMTNTVTLDLFHLPRPLSGCELADWIRTHGLR